MASETLGFLANLSNSATKLLVFKMLDDGETKQTVAEIMRICGFGSRHTYYAAKSELAQADLEGLYKNGAKTALMTGAKTAPGSAKTAPIGVQKMHSGAKTALPMSAENALLDKSWVERAADADELAGDGKREQQKLVVVAAWEDMFPDSQKIHINQAAMWLQTMKWVCSDVVGSMVVLQESGISPERRIGWMRKTTANPVWKQKAKQVTKDVEPRYTEQQIQATYDFYLAKYGPEEAQSMVDSMRESA